MKKTLCILLTFMLALLCGCSKPTSNISAVTEKLEFTAELNYNGEEYIFKTEIPKISSMKIEILKPERLTGTVLEFDSSNISVKNNKLEYKENISALGKSPLTFLYEIYSDIPAKNYEVLNENDGFYILGESKNYKYKMLLSTLGLPLEIHDSQNKIYVIIKETAVKN